MFCAGASASAADAAQPGESFELERLPSDGERLVLTHDGKRLAIRKAPAANVRLSPLPLAGDLLAAAVPVPFGLEERCGVRAAGSGLQLDCKAGRATAGLLLKFDARYPRGAALAGRIEAEGDSGFLAQFGYTGEDADAPGAVSGGTFPLPAGQSLEAAQLVILAPRSGGTLHIKSLGLAPAAAVPALLKAAAWAWEPELWQQSGEKLLSAASDRGLDRLNITLSIRDGRIEDPALLARFVAAARRQGIAIEAVEGDPNMVFEAGLAAAQERMRAIAAYQNSAPPEARLAGVQLDIEPYSLAAWGRPPAGYGGWSNAVRTLARTLREPIHLVLPFWLAEEDDGEAFLNEIAPAVSGVTVMAYRTDAALLTRIVEPLLHWSGAAGKPLRVALEAGPVEEETEEHFVAAPRGRIAVAQMGERVVATVMRQEASVPGARMFASTGSVRTRPERISFLGAEGRMVATAGALSAPLAAWPAFDGFSYHGLRWR